MTAKAVTFSVAIGSDGFLIARSVAEALKYEYYDSELTSQIASQVGASPDEVALAVERVPSLAERIVNQLAFSGTAAARSLAMAEPSPETLTASLRALSTEHYGLLIEQLVRELAAKGESVIVGHASQVTLQHEGGVLKVLIRGSPQRRAERFAKERGVTSVEAQVTVDRSDRDRANFFRRIHHVDWLNAQLYDLCVNSDVVPLSVATDLVVATANQIRGIAPEPSTQPPPQ
jgi:cytidylate kinase